MIPIVRSIGLAMGVLVWGMITMVVGWASGRFGLMGLTPQEPTNPALNYIGVLVAMGALGISSFIRTSREDDAQQPLVSEVHRAEFSSLHDDTEERAAPATGAAVLVVSAPASASLAASSASLTSAASSSTTASTSTALPAVSSASSVSTTSSSSGAPPSSHATNVVVAAPKAAPLSYSPEEDGTRATSKVESAGAAASTGGDNEMWVDRLTPKQQKLVGYACSLVAGLCYGTSLNPCQYVVDRPDEFPGASPYLIDQTFPMLSGIFVTNTAFFLVYIVAMKNQPRLFPETTLPAFVSGAMWAVAQTLLLFANTNLEQVITFPLVTTGPSLIASLWGVFMFREIRGTRNFKFLAATFAVSMVAAAFIVLSKLG